MVLSLVLAFGLLAHCFVLVPCSPTTIKGVPELPDPAQVQESAETMFEEYWQITLQEFPETATTLGDTRYDDRLTSYSLKCHEKRKVMYSEFLERANQLLAQASKGSDTENNLQLFIYNMQFKLDSLMSGSYVFPVSNLDTPQMNLLYLTKYMKLKTAEQYNNLLSRYKAFPKQIDEIIELMKEGIRTNYTLHNVSMITNHDQWNQKATESPFYKPFSNISDAVSEDDRKILQENATNIITNILIPSFVKLADFMKNEYSRHTRPEIGVGSLPQGREYYRQQLSQYLTDTSADPDEVHRLGTQEVARIALEMQQVIHLLGLKMTRKEFTDQLRKNASQFFKSEEEAIETYRHTLKSVIPPKLTKIFKAIPSKELRVEKVPNELATGPQAFYMIPSADNSTPGTFYLDTSNLGNIPKYDLITLSLHEGVPGHHFQQSFILEQVGVPAFRKYDMRSSAYMEGWALYAEYLGYELGLYEDLFMRYGHLSQEIFRACRMVVDTGMHVMGWSRQRAIDYMLEYSASTLGNIEREVDRYITWPGQACAYKYGELKIKEFRTKAEAELGERFDVKEFHDVVLRSSGPLQYVGKQIDRYIQSRLVD